MGCGASASKNGDSGKVNPEIEAELRKMGWVKDDPTAPTKPPLSAEESADLKKKETWAVDQANWDEKRSANTNIRQSRAHTNNPEGKHFPRSNTAFQNALEFVAKVPLLRNVPKSDLPLIVTSMDEHEYKPGEIVVKQGEDTDQLFLVMEGEADVVIQDDDPDGHNETLSLTTGDCFGEQEFQLKQPARATVRASGEKALKTLSIGHDAFYRLELHERLIFPKRKNMVGVRKRRESRRPSKIAVKDDAQKPREFLQKVLEGNTYLPTFYDFTQEALQEVINQLVAVAEKEEVQKGNVMFEQGDMHFERFCIIESGCFELEGKRTEDAIGQLAGSCGHAFGEKRGRDANSWQGRSGPGGTFGEMELFYSLPAGATVTCVEDAVIWCVGRSEFTGIFEEQIKVRLKGYVEALRGVDWFTQFLKNEEFDELAKAATEVTYEQNDFIVEAGEESDGCYILTTGEAVMLRKGEGDDPKEEVVRTFAACDVKSAFFGQEEMLKPGKLTVSVKVTSETAKVLCIDRETFDLVLEPLDGLVTRASKEGQARTPTPCNQSQMLKKAKKDTCNRFCLPEIRKEKSELEFLREDLEFVGNLGAGQFGVVDLVVDKKSERKFAFKRIHPAGLAEPWHRRQVKMEKWVLSMTDSAFLVRLYATYKEQRSLAFLMELVTGGDLRHALYRDGIRGNADCARFYAAGALLALEHLHIRRIIHRDLKPDNVLLDAQGWPKVTDFGLAKFCVGKTFTSCGTPNYMAPESFQAGGHDLAVDWWSLGVFIYELMAGRTPFESKTGDFRELLRKINKGIGRPEKWPWPKNFGPQLPRFLNCLLQTHPGSRLPMRHHGIEKVESHPWFENFDWNAFQGLTMSPPVVPPSLGKLKPCKSPPKEDVAEGPEFDEDSFSDDGL